MNRSAEVTDAFRSYLGAIAQGNVAMLEEILASDVLLIGTDPSEWWTGHDATVRAFRVQMEEMGGGFPIKPTNPEAYSDGNVGWASDQPTLSLPDGDVSLRLTAVFLKERGRWRIVQSHVSIGVRNEEAIGKELSI